MTASITTTASQTTAAHIRHLRAVGVRRRRLILISLGVTVTVTFLVTLMVGHTFYPPTDVLRVIVGEQVPGASFTVGRLRLPRAVLAVVAGMCLAVGGCAFQVMLRNPLASPDIIGISSGAGAAATFAIVVLGLNSTAVSAFAIVAGLGVALIIFWLSASRGSAGARLILIGIGVAAMLHSATAYILSQAAEWDLQAATRWLTGSLNNTTWSATVPALIALAALTPVLLWQDRDLRLTQMGEEAATSLGVQVTRTRLITVVLAVTLVAFATAAAGPIAFVAFLSGPIAARLIGAAGGSLLLPAALVGALLVLTADLCGQFLLPTRLPVGVVTGVLGAPYLIYLIVRHNRSGGSI